MVLFLKKRIMGATLILSLLFQPMPAKAMDEVTMYTLQTAIAAIVVVMATTTPLLTAKKMLQTRFTDGVAPESYLNDAVSNLFSTLQVTVFGAPSYFAVAGTLAPLAGDLVTTGVYYWVRKTPEKEPRVKIDIRKERGDTKIKAMTVVTSREKYEFLNCQIDLRDIRKERGFCEKVTSCFRGLCKNVSGAGSPSQTDGLIVDESSVNSNGVPRDQNYGSYVDIEAGPELAANTHAELKEYTFRNETEKMSIIVHKKGVDIFFPQYSKNILSINVQIQETENPEP